jgi:HEPN domain-containing protein
MKSINDGVNEWVEKANNDLLNAEIILKSNFTKKPYDTVCFHCQQAVEKYLKGYLFKNSVVFPKTHVLEDLIKACSKIDPQFDTFLDQAGALSDYAVEMRYPDDYFMPSEQEAKEAFGTAVEIKKLVLAKLGML